MTTRFSLADKTALITGAAGLMGFEHSAAILEAGGNVVMTDVSEVALNRVRDSLVSHFDSEKIITATMDVTNLSDIRVVEAQVKSKRLRVDILINNAAIDPKVNETGGPVETSRLESFPLLQWERQLAVGLTGAFLCSQVFGPLMASDGKGGVIINIASDLSVIAPDQRLYRVEGVSSSSQPVKPVTYSVIKSGLVGLTRYLATYWGDQGVRCNALSPGGIMHEQSDDFISRVSSLIPLGRMASQDEYRAAIQFLASDGAKYMNGHNLVIDGGRSTW